MYNYEPQTHESTAVADLLQPILARYVIVEQCRCRVDLRLGVCMLALDTDYPAFLLENIHKRNKYFRKLGIVVWLLAVYTD